MLSTPSVGNIPEQVQAVGCPRWFKSAVLTLGLPLPVYSDERTSAEPVGMSQRCQRQTHALQQTGSLFDHLVSYGEQRRRHREPQCSGGLEVNGKFEFCRLHYRQIARLFTLKNSAHINAGLAIRIR
jgi:hypothetical protein